MDAGRAAVDAAGRVAADADRISADRMAAEAADADSSFRCGALLGTALPYVETRARV